MLALLFLLATADTPQIEARETVAAVAAAMAEENAEAVFAHFSPALRDQLNRNIRALLQQNEITSSISPVSNEGDDRKRVLVLDWYVEIRSKSAELALERRRQNVRCTVERNAKKKWVITALDPSTLFTPPVR